MQIDALSWKSYIQTAQFELDFITLFSALPLAAVLLGAYAEAGWKAKTAPHH